MPVRCTVFACLAACLIVCGCATKPAAPRDERSPADPWEPLNRQIHGFNTIVDKWTLRPIAIGYVAAIPSPVRTGVRNFSVNLRTPLNAINHFLQGKVRSGFSETVRFLANSTFGLFGLIDVATDMGLEQQNEGFGETFAVWGVPDGPFVIVPILGPYTLRDALSIPLNVYGDLLIHYSNSSVRDKLYFLRLIDLRARAFAIEALLEGSPDRYISVRESYLQHRRFLIHDGNLPNEEDMYDDFMDDEDEDY